MVKWRNSSLFIFFRMELLQRRPFPFWGIVKILLISGTPSQAAVFLSLAQFDLRIGATG
jgi:hypothetical protein